MTESVIDEGFGVSYQTMQADQTEQEEIDNPFAMKNFINQNEPSTLLGSEIEFKELNNKTPLASSNPTTDFDFNFKGFDNFAKFVDFEESKH